MVRRPSEAPRAWDDCDEVLNLMSRGASYQEALHNVRTDESWELVDASNARWRSRLLADVDMCTGASTDAGATGAGVLAATFAMAVFLLVGVWLLNYAAAAMSP